MNKVPYKAPEFNLPDSDGVTHSLDDYKGKWVVLYFYPKDETAQLVVQLKLVVCAMHATKSLN